MQSAAFYLLTSLIWGSTWLVITFQLGVVPPEASIVYRFALAALLLMVYVLARRLPMRFTLRQHAFIALQGTFLFSLNYILVYLAEQNLTSGLVAIVFSMLILSNVVLGAIFLRAPIRPRVVLGGVIGVAGLALVFRPDLSGFVGGSGWRLGLLLSVGAVLSASVGNILSARNQRAGLPVVQTNAYGMAYGAAVTLILAVVRGVPFTFDPTPSYVLSLVYLAIFGSVIAFGTYLTLIGRMGVDRAAYIGVIFPLVALLLSMMFEGLGLGVVGLAGVALVAAGNVLVLNRRRPASAPNPAER
ncbi:MAG TPA: EamA family transporter [Anaerolineales bacterium]|nr:EamA family transporter [Anaerolineales bacterium]